MGGNELTNHNHRERQEPIAAGESFQEIPAGRGSMRNTDICANEATAIEFNERVKHHLEDWELDCTTTQEVGRALVNHRRLRQVVVTLSSLVLALDSPCSWLDRC